MNELILKSAEFLKKLEEQAEKNVLYKDNLENNSFKLIAIVVNDSADFTQKQLLIKFKLNGIEHSIKETLSSKQMNDLRHKDRDIPELVASKVTKILADAIQKTMLSEEAVRDYAVQMLDNILK